MTKILYEPERLHLRIEGHAGSAPKGEDLVCAGVSALGFALAKAALERGGHVVTDEQRALIDVRCNPEGGGEETGVPAMLETIAGGLELLAERYPDYVILERRA
jgi:Predicted ribosomal protein